jgi:hypothetical protein
LFKYYPLDTSASEAYREIAITELLQDSDSNQDTSQAEKEHVPTQVRSRHSTQDEMELTLLLQ